MIGVEKAARMCPKCACDSRVYDTREQADGTIRRYRECLSCGQRYITTEMFATLLRKRKKQVRPATE